jgi:amylosucrase
MKTDENDVPFLQVAMSSVPPASALPPLDGAALLKRAHAMLADDLKALSRQDQEVFWLRVEEALPRLLPPLRALYGSFDLDHLTIELLRISAQTAAARPAPLRELDVRRALTPDWFQRPDMIGYVAYAERFGGTLAGVGKHLDYLSELGVKYFHLMSVIRPRDGANDGGFAVVDYCDVDPTLGTVADLDALAASLRARDISLCIDLVMNHAAAEHEWAKRAEAGEEHYQEYFISYPDRVMPDQWEACLPEVFPELAPGNFTWNAPMKRWVWTTFNTYQWDLNYANPDVMIEMARIMGFLANVGVEILRLDAVAFTWKRMGTNSQNQPEAHLIVQALRSILDVGAPATICKAEAIVGPDQLVPYLGAHDRVVRDECELAYHNQLMVMLWSSVATRDAGLITHAMSRMRAAPTTTAWCTYVRCHDDIGWAVDDRDASAAMIGGSSHRAFLAQFFRGDFPMSFARGLAFSSNAETGDERTCGSAAALCGIDDGRLRADDVATDEGVRRLLLLYGVILGFGGIPLLYMGDELGLANDLAYVDDPDHADDSRWVQRPEMNWLTADLRHQPTTVEGRVFAGFSRLIRARRSIASMHASGVVEWVWTGHPSVAGFVRRHPVHGAVMVLANFSEHATVIAPDFPMRHGLTSPVDRLDPGPFAATGVLTMPGLGVRWIVDTDAEGVHPAPPD